MKVEDVDGLPDEIVLVDDSLASGTQLAGCVVALRRDGYEGVIRCVVGSHVVFESDARRDTHVRADVRWFDEALRANRTLREDDDEDE